MFGFCFLKNLNATALVFLFALAVSAEAVSAEAEEAVKFDVPALVGARVIPVTPDHPLAKSQKTIQITLPVTTEIRSSDRDNILEFHFNVFWNRNAYPICDYGPKTQTVSDIEGLISVDKKQESKQTLGIKLNGSYHELVDAGGAAETGQLTGETLRYKEVPQHEVLVASGTTHRGTGAFFRFHPSKALTLEGGRDLVVAFQVPQSWRGGVLQVECLASGSRKVVAWNEPFEIDRAFIVPVYLESDDQAREAAMGLVRSEQRLRKNWQQHQPAAGQSGFPQLPAFLFAGGPVKPTPRLPENWVHYLIQSSDSYLEKYQEQLPHDVAEAASEFVQARIDLLKLSR